jgi:hypothetical protein
MFVVQSIWTGLWRAPSAHQVLFSALFFVFGFFFSTFHSNAVIVWATDFLEFETQCDPRFRHRRMFRVVVYDEGKEV